MRRASCERSTRSRRCPFKGIADTLTIKLTKREPVAWLARAGDGETSAGRGLLLDAAGRTMQPYRIEPEYWRLPVIYVADPALVQQGDILSAADLHSALDLLADARVGPIACSRVCSID